MSQILNSKVNLTDIQVCTTPKTPIVVINRFSLSACRLLQSFCMGCSQRPPQKMSIRFHTFTFSENPISLSLPASGFILSLSMNTHFHFLYRLLTAPTIEDEHQVSHFHFLRKPNFTFFTGVRFHTFTFYEHPLSLSLSAAHSVHPNR